ncbi:Xyloglucanase, partial [Tulasnella sp. 427]
MKYTAATLAAFAWLSQVDAVGQYGQCGGINYTGSTVCDSPYVCVKLNDYYYQ